MRLKSLWRIAQIVNGEIVQVLYYIAFFIFIVVVAGCLDEKSVANSADFQNTLKQSTAIEVYKSPTCGCCIKWLNHLHNNNFYSTIHNFQNIASINENKGVEPSHRLCHSAISKAEYAFEGHVPEKFIQQFLKEKQENNMIGLSVPTTPFRSPGMDVGNKFHPYKVLVLKSDGAYQTFANVQSYKEQF